MLGRSRGGFTIKLHARCDAKGRPLGFVLTPGQAHDVNGFSPLFWMITDKIEAFLANKGHDADAIRDEIAKAGVEAVIPAKSSRKSPAPHDREKYRWRNLVERACPMISQIMRCCAQQTQKLAQGRHPIRQNQRILPRLRRHRLNQTVDTLCPRNLNSANC